MKWCSHLSVSRNNRITHATAEMKSQMKLRQDQRKKKRGPKRGKGARRRAGKKRKKKKKKNEEKKTTIGESDTILLKTASREGDPKPTYKRRKGSLKIA